MFALPKTTYLIFVALVSALIIVLSIQRPYPDQIFYGEKLEEYRSWETSWRGLFLIHECGREGRGIRSAATLDYCFMIGKDVFAHGLKDVIQFKKSIPCRGSLNYWRAKKPEQKKAFEEAIAYLREAA